MANEKASNSEYKKCHFCQEEVRQEATKCKHCGEIITKRCPACLENIELDVKTCPHCGSSVDGIDKSKAKTKAPKTSIEGLTRAVLYPFNWFVGLLLIFGAGGEVIDGRHYAYLTFVVIVGLLFIPPVAKVIEENFNKKINPLIKLILFIVVMIASMNLK